MAVSEPDRSCRPARESGVRRLYVSATPTRAIVDFHMKQGFELLAAPDPEMLAREPDDIHMERIL